MAWEKINEMFPTGGTVTDDGYITNEEIIANNLPQVQLTLFRPVRQMYAWGERMIWHADGSMERYYTNSIFPYENIDGMPLFNIYAQKIKNDLEEKEHHA